MAAMVRARHARWASELPAVSAVLMYAHLCLFGGQVTVETFDIGKTAVTNEQFRDFVRATKYKTDAEKYGSACVHSWGPLVSLLLLWVHL